MRFRNQCIDPGASIRTSTGRAGDEFRKQVTAMGIHEVLSAPRSPWQRAHVERVIGSIRRECLDHLFVFNQPSLRRTLASYFDYYHRSRTHLSLGKDSPEPRPIQPPELGRVVAEPQMGGLHHRYAPRDQFCVKARWGLWSDTLCRKTTPLWLRCGTLPRLRRTTWQRCRTTTKCASSG